MSAALVKSVHAATRFPAVPSPQAALLLSLLHQLDESQWWTAGRVADAQREQLARLVAHARKHVPWYRDRLPAVDFGDAARFAADWQRVPILTRANIQGHAARLRATERPAGHQQPRAVTTSGSTGISIAVDVTEAARLVGMALLLRDHAWHRRDLAQKHVAVRLFGHTKASWPEGQRQADWGPPENVVYATGPSAMLDIFTDVPRQIDWLVREAPGILLTFPTNARALASHCRAHAISLPSLREVRLMSEALDSATRAFLRDTWNVPVTDVYSAQEVGYIALQCPDQECYHVQAENVLVEVLRDDGSACAAGETGRVVVTSLHSFAMPLIRYEIGDLAEAGAACSCGRGLPVLERVLGRVRDMLTLPGGERRWPNLSGPFYRDIAPVVQHQIVQHTADTLEARLVVERPLTAQEEEGLRTLITERLGFPFDLVFSYPDRIERSPSGKFHEFVSQIRAEAPAAAAIGANT